MIITKHVYPPIPVRCFDWVAYQDGHEEGPYGHGETETEAYQDLMGTLVDAAEFRADCLNDR